MGDEMSGCTPRCICLLPREEALLLTPDTVPMSRGANGEAGECTRFCTLRPVCSCPPPSNKNRKSKGGNEADCGQGCTKKTPCPPPACPPASCCGCGK